MFRSSKSMAVWVGAISVLALEWLTGCDDDGVRPGIDGEPRLEGRIVGPQGGPLPKIVVSPLYFFDPRVTGPTARAFCPPAS